MYFLSPRLRCHLVAREPDLTVTQNNCESPQRGQHNCFKFHPFSTLHELKYTGKSLGLQDRVGVSQRAQGYLKAPVLESALQKTANASESTDLYELHPKRVAASFSDRKLDKDYSEDFGFCIFPALFWCLSWYPLTTLKTSKQKGSHYVCKQKILKNNSKSEI